MSIRKIAAVAALLALKATPCLAQTSFSTYDGLSFGMDHYNVRKQMNNVHFSLSQSQGSLIDVFQGFLNGIPVDVVALYENGYLGEIDVSVKTDTTNDAYIYHGEVNRVTGNLGLGTTDSSGIDPKTNLPTGMTESTKWVQPDGHSKVVVGITSSGNVQMTFDGSNWTH